MLAMQAEARAFRPLRPNASYRGGLGPSEADCNRQKVARIENICKQFAIVIRGFVWDLSAEIAPYSLELPLCVRLNPAQAGQPARSAARGEDQTSP